MRKNHKLFLMKNRNFDILDCFHSNKKRVYAPQKEVVKLSKLQKWVGIFLFSFQFATIY